MHFVGKKCRMFMQFVFQSPSLETLLQTIVDAIFGSNCKFQYFLAVRQVYMGRLRVKIRKIPSFYTQMKFLPVIVSSIEK